MASSAGSAFWQTLPRVAAALLAVLAATFVLGRIVGRHGVIDTAWGLLFGAAAVVAYLASAGHGNAARRALLLIMTLVWGLRLAGHIGRRSVGKPEDPRYQRMLAGRSLGYALLMVYGLQGVLAFVIAMPVLLGCFTSGRIGVIGWLGVAVWLLGLCFEAIGDRQLERYKADPDRGPVLDTGLWRYTRHPNYFGDACDWIGIFGVAAEHRPAVLTVFSPVVMVYLPAFGSGKPMLERTMAQRPAYRDYMRRTSGFVPLPPRSGRPSEQR